MVPRPVGQAAATLSLKGLRDLIDALELELSDCPSLVRLFANELGGALDEFLGHRGSQQ
jgi:hypothetical protein